MFTNDELASLLLNAIGTHPSLDNKLHLMDALEELFDNVERQRERAEGWKKHTFKYEKAMKDILKVETDSWEGDLEEIHKIAKESLGKRYKATK